tara:strand:+ start:96 stop:491 length:396 start_codon:yes stop_codon:yes gene_type:complete
MKYPKNKNFSSLMANRDATRSSMGPMRLNLPLVDLAEPMTSGSMRETKLEDEMLMSNQQISEMLMPMAGMRMLKGSPELVKLLKTFDNSKAMPNATKMLKKTMSKFVENPNEKTLASLKNFYQLYMKGMKK